MANLPRPRATRTTGYALVVLGTAIALANWLTEKTSLRHFPEGHSALYVLIGLVVAAVGLRIASTVDES